MTCHLCGGSDAKTVKFKTGHVLPQCEACTKLGGEANIERMTHGSRMSILEPDDFKMKPACSQIWLMAHFRFNHETCH